MDATKRYRRSKMAKLKLLLEAGVTLERNHKVNDYGHFTAKAADLRILLSAPPNHMLSAPEPVAHLNDILTSDPVVLPFTLEIWTPSRKVLNARYHEGAIEVLSFRRGPWEEDLFRVAQSLPVQGSTLFIDYHVEATDRCWRLH
jgi:hypothetical protein